jgi:alpha-N-acetylglucosaminidase
MSSLALAIAYLYMQYALAASKTYLDYKIEENPLLAAIQLFERVLSQEHQPEAFEIRLIDKQDGKEVMKIGPGRERPVLIQGSSVISIASGLRWYLKDVQHTVSDWRTYHISHDLHFDTPFQEQTRVRSVPYTYYENVCTVSYSQAFWKWDDWEKHLDWMAMNGINLPLAFGGQEYVWLQLLTDSPYNLTLEEVQEFVSGPAFYAWQRMGNIRGWGGPLSLEAMEQQYHLQLQILTRMRELGMTPVLSAFSGHVPKALTVKYPHVNWTRSPNWGNFPEEECCVYLAPFDDPIFLELGKAYLLKQKQLFGLTGIYNCDTYNEMRPPTSNLTFLAKAGELVYNSMKAADVNATWLMQGWLFVDDSFWTNDRIKAYLSRVPNDKMVILDLFSDEAPIWNKTDSYFGKSWIWNTLHNFGGNNGMCGDLQSYATGPSEAMKESPTMIGVGITMEGIWQNYIVYDLTLETAWHDQAIVVEDYVEAYAGSRYGVGEDVPEEAIRAWTRLRETAYNHTTFFQGVTKNLMVLRPSLKLYHEGGFMPVSVDYDQYKFAEAWKLFVQAWTHYDDPHTSQVHYDLVDIGRQVLSNLFLESYLNLTSLVSSGNWTEVEKMGIRMVELIDNLDELTRTNEHWMLGPWLEQAQSMAERDDEKLFLFNARNQLTLWGPRGEISDYASKQWNGLVGTYYRPRWELFLKTLVQNKTNFTQATFNNLVFNTVEAPWQKLPGFEPGIARIPEGDVIQISGRLVEKWLPLVRRGKPETKNGFTVDQYLSNIFRLWSY